MNTKTPEQIENTIIIEDPNIETITLDNPIKRGEQTITTLTIRKPKTGALRGIALADVLKIDVDAMIKIIPRVSNPNVTESEVSDLDLADFTKLATAVVGFFAPQSERLKIKAEQNTHSYRAM